MNKLRKVVALLVIAAFLLAGVLYLKERLAGTAPDSGAETAQTQQSTEAPAAQSGQSSGAAGQESAAGQSGTLDPDGSYTAKEDVARYLHEYGRLPANYITKKQAEALGWDSSAGNLWDVAPGKSIGGSRFGNYEGSLPQADGRTWYECDIGYDGGYRGAERLLYSSDGLIYYTGDHYKTFEQLY